jgi:hypothetical protein
MEEWIYNNPFKLVLGLVFIFMILYYYQMVHLYAKHRKHLSEIEKRKKAKTLLNECKGKG